MKISLLKMLSIASILSTLSCTSLSHKSDRDPASIAEACGDQTLSVDPAKLASQVYFQLLNQPVENYEAEYARLNLMVTKSGVYSFTGVDPRLTLARKAGFAERIYSLAPAERPSPTDSQVQGKAGDLIRIGRTDEARKLLLDLSERSSVTAELRMAARLDLLKSYRFQGSDDEFLKQLEKNRGWYKRTFDKTPGAAKQYSNFKQALIRAHTKKEKFDVALSEIKSLRKFLSHAGLSMAGADWMMGRLYELMEQPENARDTYELALRELPSDDVSKEQVTWQLGWMNYKLRRYQTAIELWAQLPATGAAQVLARNAYWTAKATSAQGQDAKPLYSRLLLSYPGTFYAPLASRELGEKIQPLSLASNDCEVAGRVIARLKRKYLAEDAQGFAQLYRQKDFARAKIFLMDLSLSRGFDSSLLLAAATLGDYQPIILGFSKLPLSEQNELFREFPQLLYPNPYPASIAAAASANSLDPYFPLSTIRQESVFVPIAQSFADARGLMQVMPQLGEKYARDLAIANYSTERLFEPAVNIPIGTRHLKEGFEQNHESYILTLASYNAGDEIAAVWAKHLSKDALEFIEEIPFNETNGYVKAILRNEIYNRALYGHAAFEYPQELLKR